MMNNETLQQFDKETTESFGGNGVAAQTASSKLELTIKL